MRAQFTLRFAICAVLVALTWAVFGQTLGHDFVNYDDNKYVYENAEISRGLSLSGIGWAFTHFDKDNWHPLTSISHMIDVELFDLKPGGHHFTNVLLHSIAVLLLFLLLAQMTGNLWASGFVAALFAIHPLHVESVAWIAERKDVLSAVFFMVTLGAYAHYAKQPSAVRYITMSILFLCGLMSKAMLVTVPLILLLLDYWPLGRTQRTENRGQRTGKLLIEKTPLFVLAAISAGVTVLAQKNWELRLEELPLSWRISNAASAGVIYLRQMIWPAKLAVIYPHQDAISIWQSAGTATLLLAITVAVFLFRKRAPYLITGWFWYLIMLVPVLGFIKVGGLAHADRYTYLPQIGLYVAVTWAIIDLTKFGSAQRGVVPVAAAALIAAFGWVAWKQTTYWRNGETLWRHTIAVTTDNGLAHFILADFLAKHQRSDEAVKEYEAGLGSDPNNSDAENNLANLLLEKGRTVEAVTHYRNIVAREPGSALAHFNLAVGLQREGRLAEAIMQYRTTLRIQPDYPDAAVYLRQAQLENGEPGENEKR